MSSKQYEDQYAFVDEDGEGSSPRGSRKWIGAVVAVAAVAALAFGGTTIVNAMGGGGLQPEDVLPGNAIAFSKLDLNPAVGQKVAVYKLASKFPTIKGNVTSEADAIKDSVLGSLFDGKTGKDGKTTLEYKKDIKPWIGDRIGIAAFQPIPGSKEPEFGMAIAYTDQAAAKVAMDKLAASGTGRFDTNGMKVKPSKTGYAFADGYVIISGTTASATAMVKAGKEKPLAASKYSEDVKSLGGDQIAVVWIDAAATQKAIPSDEANMMTGGLFGLLDGSEKALTGRFVSGLHADPSFIEVTGKTIDYKVPSYMSQLPAAKPGMIASFPAKSVGAVSITGLGKIIGALYTEASKDDKMGIAETVGGAGITSAKDIENLLGDETGVVVDAKPSKGGPMPQIEAAVRTRGGNPDFALKIVEQSMPNQNGGDPTLVRKILSSDGIGPDGIIVGTGKVLPQSMFNKATPKLGDAASFKLVMPDIDKASQAIYINLSSLIPIFDSEGTAKEAAAVKPLDALGITVQGTTDSTFRVRLSVK